MKYFKLLYNYNKSKNYIICNSKNELEYNFKKGLFVNEYNEINFFYNPDEGEIISDYISHIDRIPLFSEKFKVLTEELLKSYVQYLPVNIINVKSNKIIKAFILNIVEVIDALSLQHSKYTTTIFKNKEYFNVSKYALKKEVLKNTPIIRLENDLIPIFISEDLKKIIQKNKLIGFDFTEVLLV